MSDPVDRYFHRVHTLAADLSRYLSDREVDTPLALAALLTLVGAELERHQTHPATPDSIRDLVALIHEVLVDLGVAMIRADRSMDVH